MGEHRQMLGGGEARAFQAASLVLVPAHSRVGNIMPRGGSSLCVVALDPGTDRVTPAEQDQLTVNGIAFRTTA
jgi:hypothetical protein